MSRPDVVLAGQGVSAFWESPEKSSASENLAKEKSGGFSDLS